MGGGGRQKHKGSRRISRAERIGIPMHSQARSHAPQPFLSASQFAPPAPAQPATPSQSAKPSQTADAFAMFASPPPRKTPIDGPATASGYIRKIEREAKPDEVGYVREVLAPGLLSAVMTRVPRISPSPMQIVAALEESLGGAATASQKIETMLAVSEALRMVIAGPLPIDPEMADHLLLRNTQNRSISSPTLQRYCDDMDKDQWDENGTGISISETGDMNDGQHRMHAIRRTGTTQRMNISVGVTRKSRRTNDIGRGRTAADMMRQEGTPNSVLVSALARAVMGYETGTKKSLGSPSVISSPSVQQRADSDPDIMSSARWAKNAQQHLTGLMTGTMAAFMHYFLNQIDPQDADAYLGGILTGAENGRGLDVEDPRWVVRERLRRDSSPRGSVMRFEILIRGWNAHRGMTKAGAIKVLGELPPITTDKRPAKR